MATRAENLEAALDNIARQIEEITRNPKPSYTIDGQSVSWTEHLRALMEGQKLIKEQIDDDDGPFEIRSVGRVC